MICSAVYSREVRNDWKRYGRGDFFMEIMTRQELMRQLAGVNSADFKFKRKNKLNENRLQLAVIKYLRARGCVCGKVKNKGSFYKGRFILDPYAFLGVPDLICFSPNLSFLEIKTPAGRLSIHQKQFQKLCYHANIPYLIIRSMEDVEKAFFSTIKNT